jgi:hypothetical protein
MDRVTITRRARQALKLANAKASDIAERHRSRCRGERKGQRTRHWLETGDVVWAISSYPHERVFFDCPPRDLPRSLSIFLDGFSLDLIEFLSAAAKHDSGPASGDRPPFNAKTPRQLSRLREYNLNKAAYLSRLIPKSAKLRTVGLLDMFYTPEELAAELNMNTRLVQDILIPEGMPHKKDKKGRLFLHGPQVQAWIASMRAKLPHLEADQVYCLGCRKVVPLVKPRRVRKGSLVLLQARCPECGARVNRGAKAR